MRALDEFREIGPRRVLTASVTPLASIFGSGFLIIVPVLERTLGGLAVVGAIGVSAVAWVIGTAIRHNIKAIEPLAAKHELGEGNERLERLSDIVIAVAYVVSVALYLRIMAEYLVDYVAPGSSTATSVVAAASMAIIVLVGVTRGFTGLDLTERIALATVLVITTVLGAAYLFESGGRLLGDGIDLPPVPDAGIGTTLLMLGGIVITVQGFETVRYLADEYDAPTRIWASRIAQATAASIYVGFTIVALASRAFAAYYCLQCVLAVRTASSVRGRVGFGALAAVMALITLFAEPVG